MVKVKFLPDEKVGVVPKGSTLLDAAHAAGVFINSSCGGGGVCGECAVRVLEGDHYEEPNAHLTEEQRNMGMVLSCLAVVRSNAVVEVPIQAQLDDQGILKGCGESPRDSGAEPIPPGELKPASRRVILDVQPPSLEANSDDWSRLKVALRKAGFGDEPHAELDVLRSMPAKLRQWNWRCAAAMSADNGEWTLIDLASPEGSTANYGLAVDVGTTTIVVELVDLDRGLPVDCEGAYNGQMAYGADVITRIIHCERQAHGLDGLHRAVIGTMGGLIQTMLKRRRLGPEAVTSMVASGNTVMSHLLLKVDPGNIRREPYVPAFTALAPLRAADAGLEAAGRARLFAMPSVSGFVGGDITSGILAAGLHKSEKLTLFVDIGTNGEIVLGNRDWLTTCSCSAGPAFEGSGVEFGMRAATGAIDSVKIDPDRDRVELRVVGGGKPRGICGTGLISAMGAMLRAGIINRSGNIARDLETPRVREGAEGFEYVLAWEREAMRQDDIVLTEADIKNLIRSKGAVFAGIKVLLGKVGLELDAVERFLIAGGFGNSLDIDQAVGIGLLPDLPRDRYEFIGNSSLKGARNLLLNRDLAEEALEIAGMMTYIELSNSNEFMDQYTAALFLPHTDMSLFPSLGGDA